MRHLIIALIIALILSTVAEAKKLTCKDFFTQAAAQKAYDSDPVYYRNLDRDRDGIACEALR